MLKRNGETCRIEVPNFAGKLTPLEHQAYTIAMAGIGVEVRQYNEAAGALTELRQEMQRLGKDAERLLGTAVGTIEISGSEGGGSWQIQRSLFKSGQNQLLLCSRHTGTEQEFGIVEKFDPASAYARAHGDCELLITGNNMQLVLQDHIENETRMLDAFKNGVEAKVDEILSERFPGDNLNRVAKAVSAQYSKGASANTINNQPPKQVQGVKVRL